MYSRLGRMPWAIVWLFLATALPAASPPGDQLRTLARQLEADDVSVREEASRGLLGAGDAAVMPLIERLQIARPAAAVHAATILEQIAARGDDSTQQSIAAGLAQLSQSGKPALAALAQELTSKQARLRVERAVARIRKLGGKFDGDSDRHPVFSRLQVAADNPAPLIEAPPASEQPVAPPPISADGISPSASPLVPGLIADAYVAPSIAAGLEQVQPEMSLTIDGQWRGSDADLALLKELPNLVTLRIHHAPLTDASLCHLRGLERMRSVEIENCAFSSGALVRFQEQHSHVRIVVNGEQTPQR